MLGFGIYGFSSKIVNTMFEFRLAKLDAYQEAHAGYSDLPPVTLIFPPMLSLGAFIGSIFFGFITIIFGRKKTLLCMPIPMMVNTNYSTKKTFSQLF